MAMNYSDKVMEHFTNPQNVGEIENASGCGTVGNAVCGDIMRRRWRSRTRPSWRP